MSSKFLSALYSYNKRNCCTNSFQVQSNLTRYAVNVLVALLTSHNIE